MFRSQESRMGALGSKLSSGCRGIVVHVLKVIFWLTVTCCQDKAVQLFHAFAPMLCKRPTKKIEDSIKEVGGSEFFIEEKLDGERMQLHKRGNEYFYCSRFVTLPSKHIRLPSKLTDDRKGKDYTYLYGKHVGAGSLTPFIDQAFDPRVDE
jgi:DNA ligase 4